MSKRDSIRSRSSRPFLGSHPFVVIHAEVLFMPRIALLSRWLTLGALALSAGALHAKDINLLNVS